MTKTRMARTSVRLIATMPIAMITVSIQKHDIDNDDKISGDDFNNDDFKTTILMIMRAMVIWRVMLI